MTQIGKITRFSILLLMSLCSCAPVSIEDLRAEGEAQTRKLVSQLRMIETREELQREVPRLKKQFSKLADLLVDVRAYSMMESEPTIVSEELFAEMARLYEISGCRELIESSQEEAIDRLRYSDSKRH